MLDEAWCPWCIPPPPLLVHCIALSPTPWPSANNTLVVLCCIKQYIPLDHTLEQPCHPLYGQHPRRMGRHSQRHVLDRMGGDAHVHLHHLHAIVGGGRPAGPWGRGALCVGPRHHRRVPVLHYESHEATLKGEGEWVGQLKVNGNGFTCHTGSATGDREGGCCAYVESAAGEGGGFGGSELVCGWWVECRLCGWVGGVRGGCRGMRMS